MGSPAPPASTATATTTTTTAIAMLPPPPRSYRRTRRVFAHSKSHEAIRLDEKQYRARSHAEFMQTHNCRERLHLYEKTFELCMRADPQLSGWIEKRQKKGLPKAMTDTGYAPPPRRRLSASSSKSWDSTSSSRSGSSLSLFMKKAGSIHPSTECHGTMPEPKSSASRFLSTSLSRLSSTSRVKRRLSRTQQPQQPQAHKVAPCPPPPSPQANQKKPAPTPSSSVLLDRLRSRKQQTGQQRTASSGHPHRSSPVVASRILHSSLSSRARPLVSVHA